MGQSTLHHAEEIPVAGVRKWGISLASLACLGLAATPVRAIDYTAYAKLLQAHVRPRTISGIRLNVVDYRGVKADPNYARALQDFATVKPAAFRTDAERLAFWVNAYNLLAIKAVIDQYPTESIRDGDSLFRSIWKKKVGTVGNKAYALDDIEHGILRKRFQEPRVHFAIVCASLSCPDLRTEPYVAEHLDTQLDDAARTFLQNSTKGLLPGRDGQPAKVSLIFKWFREDFEPVGGVVNFIRAKIDPTVAARIAGLTDNELSYLDYDWSLNDTARAR
ncbi:MAG: DUF547 domain-containing protein [Candidatus Methylomirabilales bacterium]